MRAALFLLALTATAAEIILPSNALERDAPVTAVYRTNPQAAGKATLKILWTDMLGRTVEDRTLALDLTDETEIRFPLDLRRAVAMANTLQVRFTLDGRNLKGAPDRRDETATINFIAKPPTRQWDDYEIMMWQSHTPEQGAQYIARGISGGQYNGRSRTPPEFLLKNNLRWYSENIATDFYAEYHRYRPDRIQQWSWLQAKELYKKDPTSLEAFKRHPSLNDPAWLATIRQRLIDAARTWSPYRPIFYDLADESGIADLAAFWDFDFSDHSLAEMRQWLKEKYGTIAALNRQWGTRYTAWDAVIPETTNQAFKHTDENYSAWSDHKEWMDVSFARALKFGADAIRSVDPDAYVAIAGAQMPGWGGYDYARLTQALPALEPYDIGNNIEIIRSLNPNLAFITTAFEKGPWEQHRIWYELLHGARGNIIWNEKDEFSGPRGQEAAAYYNEIRGGLGAQLIASRRLAGPIAIHYSQPSLRAEWLRAHRAQGEAWINRTSSAERMDSDFLRLRESYCRLIEDLGLQYDFVSYLQLEAGELARGGYRALILPRSSALSDKESEAIREFVQQGGLVIADGEPGQYDTSIKKRAEPSLQGVRYSQMDVLNYHQQRLTGKERPTLQQMAALLEDFRPEFQVSDSAGIETHTFSNGGVRIVGLLSNPQLRVNELGPPDFKSNQRFEKVRRVTLTLPAPLQAYDLRQSKALGIQTKLDITLDPYQPALYAFSPVAIEPLRVAAPREVNRGEMATLALAVGDRTPAATHVFHVEVRNPEGKAVAHYTANVIAPNGRAAHLWRTARNDAPGRWTVVVKDALTGQTQTREIELRP
ncbi:MAG: beta-galactosidase [Acidobacteria bacterium]|nr:beta-galactosidase [Acidobacteriota bacterium]